MLRRRIERRLGPGSSTAVDECLERLSVPSVETEGAHEQSDRIAAWDMRAPALPLADTSRADAGTFG